MVVSVIVTGTGGEDKPLSAAPATSEVNAPCGNARP
jgi:hypothetical protein